MAIVWVAVRSSTARLHNPPDSRGREEKHPKKKVEKKIRMPPGSRQRESKCDRGECEGSHKRTACVRRNAEGGQSSMSLAYSGLL